MKQNGRILFVLGGLAIGGVETYVVRLAKELNRQRHSVDVILLSARADKKLMAEISTCARVQVIENASFLSASSWVNALLPLGRKFQKEAYDVVHVVDMLTLGFVYLNRRLIQAKHLSIGIYHAKELTWWRDRPVYFRRKLLELFDQNVGLTLFPSQVMAELGAQLAGQPVEEMHVLPLGIDLSRYAHCAPDHKSTKIVSVGRLVDFKMYNRHMISQLAQIRRLRAFEYFVYGDGPEKDALQRLSEQCGVADYVHFMGAIEYKTLPGLLNGVFCFVGSGTSIIEASAAGIPSVVGIESIKTPHTCGFFSDVVGAAYNELSATTHRMAFVDIFGQLVSMNESAYLALSTAHRAKAAEFDIQHTAAELVSMSNRAPNFNFSFSRWLALASFFLSVIRLGPQALKRRFDDPAPAAGRS
jgi:1,2-diacylglycerol 3-alpha-glucosyltransferase